MSVSRSELESFHSFALQAIGRTEVDETVAPVTMHDLVEMWRDTRDRDAIVSAIEEGLSDVRHGRTVSAEDHASSLQAKYGLSPE